MARLARVVVPETPHHITQRGNRRQQTFFVEGDYRTYLDLAAEEFAGAGVEDWACCLMPNPIHLIAAPSRPEALAQSMVRQVCSGYRIEPCSAILSFGPDVPF